MKILYVYMNKHQSLETWYGPYDVFLFYKQYMKDIRFLDNFRPFDELPVSLITKDYFSYASYKYKIFDYLIYDTSYLNIKWQGYSLIRNIAYPYQPSGFYYSTDWMNMQVLTKLTMKGQYIISSTDHTVDWTLVLLYEPFINKLGLMFSINF